VTVYVDDMHMPAVVAGLNRSWSHMIADTPEELGVMARRLRLKEAWRQYPGTWKEHFDVTDAVREQALQQGAVAISAPHTPIMQMRAYERRYSAQFVSDLLPGLEEALTTDTAELPPLPPGLKASLDRVTTSWARLSWPEGHPIIAYLQ